MAVNVLTVEGIRALESYVFHVQRVPSLIVMENAGRGVSDRICRDFPQPGRCLVLCGSGGNGGDGCVTARHLAIQGWRVQICLLGEAARRSQEAQCMLDAAANSGIATVSAADEKEWSRVWDGTDGFDVMVDAVFGIGLNRELSAFHQRVFRDVNGCADAKKYAVDIPSGVDGNSGRLWGESLRADCTVTFFAPKPGLLLYPGRGYAGELEIFRLHGGEDPPGENEGERERDQAIWLESSDINGFLPRRRPDAHKGNFGHGLLVGGGAGMVGAVHHAGRAALRSGLGRLTLAVPEQTAAALWAALPEGMTYALASPSGTFSRESLGDLRQLLPGKTCAAVGPGMGKSAANTEIIKMLLEQGMPVVIDADGLNALAQDLSLLEGAKGEVLLTSHPGEMARLRGVAVEEILGDPRTFAMKLAKETGAVVLLKGGSSVIAAPDGRMAYNTTGGPALAKGGSGDVLCGIALACLGQGLTAFDAACCAALLLGLSAECLPLDEKSVLASDLIEGIPQAFALARKRG